MIARVWDGQMPDTFKCSALHWYIACGRAAGVMITDDAAVPLYKCTYHKAYLSCSNIDVRTDEHTKGVFLLLFFASRMSPSRTA